MAPGRAERRKKGEIIVLVYRSALPVKSMAQAMQDKDARQMKLPRLSSNTVRCATLLALALAAAGCGRFTETFQRGYVLQEGALEQIPIGASQEQVLIVLGTPSTVATVSGEAFYYISQKTDRSVAFMPREVTDQRVIAVYFDKTRKVARLANYGVKDGK